MKPHSTDRNQLRIIAGQWRGWRLRFPNVPGLRPTPDRVRETLFNWLTPILPGARCLDLFAGSGALGLEALSRGAGEVVFVEQHAAAVAVLRENLVQLGVTTAQVNQADALRWLQRSPTPFDIVWLDPPFGQNWLVPVCAMLEQAGWLTATAWIYLESETTLGPLSLPAHWMPYRQKTAGAVAYRLLRRDYSELAAEIATSGTP